MTISVPAAAKILENRGSLRRSLQDQAERIIVHVAERLGQDIPGDLKDFYRERIYSVGDFLAISPVWNDWVGWRPDEVDVTELQSAHAVPLFLDGCGSLYGLDLTSGERPPAVYFFDHEDQFARPHWAAGSSLGAFLLLLAEHDQALQEGRPLDWVLAIDPDIDKCPRAPPLWLAD